MPNIINQRTAGSQAPQSANPSQSLSSQQGDQTGRRTMTVSEYNKANPDAPWSSGTKVAFSYGGKTYAINKQQYDWITSRYKDDWAGSYGYDVADQRAQANGQMSAKVASTYKNNGIDYQLRDLGLPSLKNLDKYLGQYEKWHTGTVDQVYKDVPKEQWSKISEFYKQDWVYESTAEDQARKKKGLMPTSLLSKYGDNELDESLMMRNLPSVSEMQKYAERYQNFTGIDTFYSNVAAKWTDMRLFSTDDEGNHIKNDDTVYTVDGEKVVGSDLYAAAFYDELLKKNENGERVYASITDLFQNNHVYEKGSSSNENYNITRGKEVVSIGKAEALADDFLRYEAFSYDDFESKYGDYFSKLFADKQLMDGEGNPATYKDGRPVTAASQLAQIDEWEKLKEEADFYNIDHDASESFNDNTSVESFLDRWNLNNPTSSALDMFTSMREHGVDDKYIKQAYVQLRDSTKFGSKERKAVKQAWNDYKATIPQKERGGLLGKIAQANRDAIADALASPDTLLPNMQEYISGMDGGLTATNIKRAVDHYAEFGVEPGIINETTKMMRDAYIANTDEVDPEVLKGFDYALSEDVKMTQRQLDESFDAFMKDSIAASSDASVVNNSWARIEGAVGKIIGDSADASIDPDTLFAIIKATADLPWSNEIAVREALADHGFTAEGDFNDPLFANEWTKNWDGLDRSRFRSMMSDAGFRLLEDVERTKPDDSLLEDIGTALGAGGGGASPVSMLAFYAIRGSKWDTSKSVGENVRDFFLPSKEEESYALNLGKSLSAKEYEIALDWMDEMVSDGRLTKFEAYNYLCSRGLQDAIEKYDKADWYESIFKEKMVPEMWENSAKTDQLFWDSCTDDDRKSIADSMWADIPDEEKAKAIEDYDWRFDNNIHRTTAQTWAEQITSIIPTVSEGIATGAVGAADWAATLVSGKDELWGVTKELQGAAASIAAYGDVEDNVNGALAARLTTDAAAEMLKMYTLGAVGTSVAGLAGEASSKFGKFMVDMLKTSPFSTAALGNNFAEAKAEGATNAEAVPYAFVLGTLEGVIESLNVDQIWGRVFGQGKFGKMLLDGGRSFANTRSVLTKAWLASLPIAALGEATEEGLSYVAEGIWKTVAAWNGSEWASQFEWSAEDAAEALLVGGLTGLLGAGLAKGSITTDSIMVDYYKNNGQLSADIVDVELASKYWDSFTDAQRSLYRNGGANVKSIDDFSNLMVQLDNCFRGLTSAQDTYSKLVANEDAKYEAVQRDVKKAEAKLASFNPLDPEQAKDFAKAYSELVKLKGDPNDANSTSALRDAKAKHDAALEAGAYNRDTTLANINAQIAMIQGQFAEHYAGLYLKNEGAIKAKDYNAIEKNMANAKKNGDKVTSETIEQPKNSAVDNTANPWWSKQKAAETMPTRQFTTDDENQVLDAAKRMNYKGKISFVDAADANWEGRIDIKSGNIEINRAKLTATDAQRLSDNPAMWVLEHELWHNMWNRGGDLTKELATTVRKMYERHPSIARGNPEENYVKLLDSIIAKRNEQGLDITTRAQAEEELIADFFRNYAFRSDAAIKSLCQTNGNLGERILSWLRYKIDDLKLRRSKESWARDILHVERQYALALREAGRRPYNEARAKASGGEMYSPATEKSYDYSRSLGDIYQDYRDGNLPTDRPVVIGGVDGALMEIGLSRLPIFMNPTHVRYAANDNAYASSHTNITEDNRLDHAFTKEEYSKLTKELGDPVAVIAYPNDKDKTINVLTSIRSKNGKRALAAIHLDSNMTVNGVRGVEGYDVKTLHGRDNYWTLLKNALEMDSDTNPQVFYLNFDKLYSELSSEDSAVKNEIVALSKAKEKTFATGKDGHHSSDQPAVNVFIRSVPESGYRVNTKPQTETKQFLNWIDGSKARNADGTPIEFWKTSNGTYTTDENAASGDNTYYLSVKQPYREDLDIVKIKYGSLRDAAVELSKKGYDSFVTKDSNGNDSYIVFRKGQAKAAENRNIGLFDRTIKNELYSASDNITDDLLNEYIGKANPNTGVTAEEDEAYMRAALAGDTETAGRMVRDMYERNGLMHVYRGEPKATGSWTQVNMDNFKGPSSGMFAATDIDTARASEYTHSYAREDLKTKPLSYGDEMPVLQQFANGVAQRIGRSTNLVAESYYMDDEGNTYAEDGKGREHHWALRDADTGDIFADSTELTTLADAAKRKAARIIGGNPQNIYNSIDDPFAGRILDLFVKFDNANEHNARGDEWDKIQLGSPKGVTLYRIEVTYDPENENLTTVTAYPIDESFDAESSSNSERGTKSITFESEDDMDYMYKLEKSFKDMFGSKSDVAEFFMDYADWGEDGATLDRVGVRDKNGRYVSPELFPDAETTSTDELALRDKAAGYDGSIIRNVRDGGSRTTTDTVSFNPNYIKSADAITYDDEGNIIPLSQRGDFERNELRYSGDLSIDQILDEMSNKNSQAELAYQDAINTYGAQPQGRTPRASDGRVPNQVNDDTRVSHLGRSLYESPHMTDDMRAEARDMMVNQNWLSYTPTTNEESMAEARNYIAARQPLAAQQEFHDMVMQGKLGRKTNAIGLQLLADASARGDVDSFYAIATDLQVAATEAGQSAQIFNVLKELKGVGSAYYMQRVVDRLNAKYDDQIQQGKMQRITVSPVLMEQLSQARTVDQITEAEEAVAKEIATQVPLTWTDRLSSWRYFSMLGNPTTHIRNMTGNLLMKGLNAAKDAVATGIESIGNIDQSQRAHAVLTGADRSMWGDFAEASYNEQARNLSGGGKLGFETFVKQNMRSFDTKWLNALAKFNFNALEGEDIMFIRPAYKNALMQYMKAQGYTLNEKGQAGKVDAKGVFREMTNAQRTAAVEWASEQAWKQTFRDASSLATMLNKLSKEGPVAKLLVEGVMPFKKTPINIAKRGLEYSPAGIIMGATQLATKVKQGKMSAATAIDNLSSGITGTALMALGVFLAKAGLIRAGGEDKKKYETYLEDTGDQTYSFKFGNASINMSSIAPATIPLFMGVALQEMASRNDGDVDLSAITDMVAGTLNPFMEMSFMASLNSALQNYSSNGIGGALGNTLLTAAQNYGSQYLPTLGGKVAQFVDPTRRTTKSDATSPIGGNMDYYLRSLAKKVPGFESTLQADVDVWGRTDTKDSFGDWALDFANKFVLPTNVKVANRDAVDRELIRVVESTGVVDFLPSDGNKYFTVKGERYNMNAKQYKEFSEDRGQAAYAAIKDAIASPSYQAASDEAKAEMLKKALDAAYKQVNNQWKEKLGAFGK